MLDIAQSTVVHGLFLSTGMGMGEGARWRVPRLSALVIIHLKDNTHWKRKESSVDMH